MSVLNGLNAQFEIASWDICSSEDEITELMKYSKIDIPREYLEIIKEKTEIEICVNGEKYLRIWGAKGYVEMNEAYSIQRYIPKSLAFADDECCNVLLFLKGHDGDGIYLASLSDLSVDDMIFIADSLEAFLVKGKGIEVFNSI